MAEADREQWLDMYEQMFKIRTFEEHVNELYQGAKMPGLAHLYIGEEAVGAGVCATLRSMTTSSAPIAGTAMSSPKAATLTG